MLSSGTLFAPIKSASGLGISALPSRFLVSALSESDILDGNEAGLPAKSNADAKSTAPDSVSNDWRKSRAIW